MYIQILIVMFYISSVALERLQSKSKNPKAKIQKQKSKSKNPKAKIQKRLYDDDADGMQCNMPTKASLNGEDCAALWWKSKEASHVHCSRPFSAVGVASSRLPLSPPATFCSPSP